MISLGNKENREEWTRVWTRITTSLSSRFHLNMVCIPKYAFIIIFFYSHQKQHNMLFCCQNDFLRPLFFLFFCRKHWGYKKWSNCSVSSGRTCITTQHVQACPSIISQVGKVWESFPHIFLQQQKHSSIYLHKRKTHVSTISILASRFHFFWTLL